MKQILKKMVVCLLFLGAFTSAHAQSDDPMDALRQSFPQLTELFSDELSNYPAHYIFAVDVSGTMYKHEALVTSSLKPFVDALPDKDRVHVIPFGADAKISELGFFGVIDSGVKKSLKNNINNLYRKTYEDGFMQYTDIPNAVYGISKVIQNNPEYKVNIVVIITDFRNDQKVGREHKIASEDLKKMHSAIKAATGDVYTRFIALQLPNTDTSAPGYCTDQLAEKVFKFDDHILEITQAQNDKNIIKEWFNQIKRDILVTKLKAIVRDANRSTPVEIKKLEKDIDGNVTAEIHWEPSKLYPTIKISETTVDGEGFKFENNRENFTQTKNKVINVELGQIKHKEYGFHKFDGNINLGLTLPTPYDKELQALEAEKPIPATSKTSPGWIFTFFLPFKVTVTILVLLLLYIIGVFKSMARNRKLKLYVTVTYNDSYGNQIGDRVRIPATGDTTDSIQVKGSVVNAGWEVLIKKKKANPFLLFTKPYFEWSQSRPFVRQGLRNQSGKLTGAITLNCGTNSQNITHSVRINPTIKTK